MEIIETIKILKKDNSNLLNTTLQFVQSEVGDTFRDIAKIHLLSAEQALISATASNDPAAETRVCIGHLRDAFNAYQTYLDKGTTFFVFWKSSWDDETTTSVQFKMASLALVISLVYRRLKDHSNYLSWKNVGVSISKTYLEKRAYLIKDWADAANYGFGSKMSEDYRKQNIYKKETVFLPLFSKAIEEV